MHEESLTDDFGKLILRLCVGGLILLHGLYLIMHPEALGAIGEKLRHFHLPDWLAYGVYLGEVVAPALLIVGILTRLGAFLIIVNMLIGVLLVHQTQLLQLGTGGGWILELEGMYLFSALAILFLGSGRIALMRD